MGEPAAGELHAAATVVVVRDGAAADGPALETLMLKRNDRGAFGGMWVFPGGRVDESDVDPAAPDNDMAAGRRAAAREAREEAGLVLDPSTFVPLSHWMPPASVVRPGFATWFFVAAGSDAVVEIDGAEIHDHAWLPPIEVLRLRDAGELSVVPPTFVTLSVLAQHSTVAELLAALDGMTPERFHTQLGRDGDTTVALWHGDESYEERPGPAGARHRLVMADDGWRYVRSAGADDPC
jgi:8-oxo-dGTP pyrophosphatase MutT (NUDIX family)